jgi:hypothetical protein
MTAKPKSIPVTSLKRTGGQAPVFDLPVSFPSIRGTVSFTLTCKALGKKEWSKARDARQAEALEFLRASAGEAAQPQDEPTGDRIDAALADLATKGMEAAVRAGDERTADTVLVFATGWDIDEEFGRDGLVALEDEYGGALAACLRAYDDAIYRGVLGN